MDARACPYRLVRPLRGNGFADSFEARSLDGKPAVIKIADPGGAASDPLGAKRFAREIALVGTLRHPGLARVLDRGGDWIAFEHLGPSLADEGMRERHASPDALRRLIESLATTLAYLHGRGVVHRDVKPAHVMFRSGAPVLIDLGAAGLCADDPLEGIEFIGSPAWMAPEQIDGAPPHPSADIWPLCALGVWLATGIPPYRGSADAVLAARRAGRPPAFLDGDLSDLDPRLAAMLRAGLGPAGKRPRAAAIATALAAPDQAMVRSTAG